MAGWRDNLLPASFRGIPFKVMDTTTMVGRRNVVHQYPFKDTSYIEDLGKDADQFTIVGYILATINNDYDYFQERDNLIAALRQQGSGTLIHPYLGDIEVSVLGKAQITETFREGGIARFVITFVQAEDIVFSTTTAIDYSWQDYIRDTVETAQDHWYDTFVKIYDVSTGFVKVISDVNNTISSYTSMIRNVINSITDLPRSAISEALGIIDEVGETLVSVLSSPCDFAGGIGNGYNAFLYLAGLYTEGVSDISYDILGECSGVERDSRDAYDESIAKSVVLKKLLELNSFGETTLGITGCGEDSISMINQYDSDNLDGIIVDTSTKAIVASNRIALVDLIRALAVMNAIRIAAVIEYVSYDDAADILTTLIDNLNSLILKLGNEAENIPYSNYGISIANEDGYNALSDLRAKLVDAITNMGGNLARIIDYEVPYATTPALVLAYNRYKDITRESEIISRNKINASHPGFLPSGDTIELLHE